jgi:hypothetical protein
MLKKRLQRAKARREEKPERPRFDAVELGSKSRARSKRVSLPLMHSKHPGKLALDNAKIFEIVPFP